MKGNLEVSLSDTTQEAIINALTDRMEKRGYRSLSAKNGGLIYGKQTDSYELSIKYGSGFDMYPKIVVSYTSLKKEPVYFIYQQMWKSLTTLGTVLRKDMTLTRVKKPHKYNTFLVSWALHST
jgi:hypothetical protein